MSKLWSFYKVHVWWLFIFSAEFLNITAHECSAMWQLSGETLFSDLHFSMWTHHQEGFTDLSAILTQSKLKTEVTVTETSADVFHYDALAMLNEFQVSASWFWLRTEMNWNQLTPGRKEKLSATCINWEMAFSNVNCMHFILLDRWCNTGTVLFKVNFLKRFIIRK